EAEVYWRGRLGGFRAATGLRVESPRHAPAPDEDRHGEQRVELSTQGTAALQSWARYHRLTLNTGVMGGWAILRSRYSGEKDVLFGSTVSGRPADLPGVESMVGLFINTLPIRVRVSRSSRLVPWLLSFQEELVDMRRYDYSPL